MICANVFLREIPEHLLAGLADGKLQLFGSIIRETSTGQIAGFLQEAAPLANWLSNPAWGLAGLVQNTGQFVQGQLLLQGMARIEHGVTVISRLNIAGVALSAVGIGVSVAGFAVLAHRIGLVQKTVEGLTEKIDQIGNKIDQIRHELVDADLAELRSLAKALDEAWSLASNARAERQWHDVAKGALSQQSRFELRAEHSLRVEQDFALAEPMFDAIAFANSLRVSAFAACNEVNAACNAADDGVKTMERLTGGIGAVDLVRACMADKKVRMGTPEWDAEFHIAKEQALPTVARIRQRESAIATCTAALPVLQEHGIASRDWLAAAREETSAPILLWRPVNPR